MNGDQAFLDFLHRTASMDVSTLPQVMGLPQSRVMIRSPGPAAGVPLSGRSGSILRQGPRRPSARTWNGRADADRRIAPDPVSPGLLHLPFGGAGHPGKHGGSRGADPPAPPVHQPDRSNPDGAGPPPAGSKGAKYSGDEALFIAQISALQGLFPTLWPLIHLFSKNLIFLKKTLAKLLHLCYTKQVVRRTPET